VPDFVGSLPLAIIVLAGVCAPLAGWLAMQRSRNPVVWFVYGALLGPIAPLLLVAAPLGSCARCGTRSRGWSARCIECGARLGGVFDEAGDDRVADPRPGTPVRATAGQVTRPPSTAAPPITVASQDTAAPPAPAAPPVRAASPVQAAPPTAAWATGGVASLRARAPQSAPVMVPRSPVTSSVTSPGDASAAIAATGEVLATAVYISGNAGMEIGACYAIALVDDRIRVFGPVDTGQLTVRHERPIDDGEVVAVDDRLIITLRRGRSTTSMIMRWVGGMAPSAVEAAFASGAHAGRTRDEMGQ
jgi:hypothetical protein